MLLCSCYLTGAAKTVIPFTTFSVTAQNFIDISVFALSKLPTSEKCLNLYVVFLTIFARSKMFTL